MITPRDGGYARGHNGFEQILRAALAVLVEDGAQGLTMRRIAAACGMKVGNIAYYFATKEELIRELLNAIIMGYEQAFNEIRHEPRTTAKVRLERLVCFILDDLTTKQTTRVFPELWALSNHDPFVEERVEDVYRRARAIFESLISEINPALPPDERALLALFMSASIEGLTMFAGHRKPWQHEMPAIKRLSVKAFLIMVEDLEPGEVRGTSRR